MRVWVGCSGYSYPDWVGPFYPSGTRPHRWLRLYCQSFPIVELNFTFYRSPTPSMLERMADQTPAGFQFIVKMPRSLSHEENPKDLPGFRAAVDALRRRDQLSGVLGQLPQATHPTAAHIAWLEFLRGELTGYRMAIEFRNHEWANPETMAWMKDLDLDSVSVDVPNLPNLYPRGLVQSSDRIYIRLHSRKAENWYASGAERYDYDFGDDVLSEWASALTAAAEPVTEAFIFFNNCAGGQAPVNANRMRRLMRQIGPNIELVEPFPEEPQSSLFD